MSKAITKQQIAAYVHITCDMEEKKARQLVDAIFTLMSNQLKSGKKVMLTGIGTITPVIKAAGEVHSFNQTYTLPERVRLKFKPSSHMKVALASKRINLVNSIRNSLTQK